MKDVQTVFIERLNDIQNNLTTGNYTVCNKIAHDLVNFAWNLELKDEVFISEILESVYHNLSDTDENYSVPDDIAEKIRSELSEKMKVVINAYPNKNPKLLYESLKELRYTTTFHQLHAWQKYDKPKKYLRSYYEPDV